MVDYVLVLLVLIPLVLGIVQLGLVLHVRNTLTAAASDGARAAAPIGATTDDGANRARELIRDSLADRYARDVVASRTTIAGGAAIRVRIGASVPALGLFGPRVRLEVTGHSVREVAR